MRCLMLLVILGAATLNAAEDIHARVESLVRAHRYAEAERLYRQALAGSPRDPRLRLGLAQVLLWSGKYPQAEEAFREVLQERPGDAAARLGFAQAAYWSGDYRSAVGRFRHVLAVDRDNAEARRALEELRAVARSRWEVSAGAADDSQPLRRIGGQGSLSFFSDPLTRWDVVIRRGRFDDDVSADTGSVRGGVTTSFPRFHLIVDATAERFTFPDETSGFLGSVAVGRKFARSSVTLSAERVPLLGTVSSLRGHTTATRYGVMWKTADNAKWLAAVNAHIVDYSDDNRGNGLDGYVIAPLRNGPVAVRAGFSAAWRDTDENRFRFTGFRSRPVSAGVFQYTFSGVYDPYWTPHRLSEGRAIVTLESLLRKTRLKLQVDGGYARDRYLAFSPASGQTPSPLFTFPLMLDRTFRPWRATVEGVVPIQSGMELRARYRHEVTAFYRANEIEASVGGHF